MLYNFECMFKTNLFFMAIHQILAKYNTSSSRITDQVAFVIDQLVSWRDIYQPTQY